MAEEDRVIGVVMGLAAGSALGAPLEHAKPGAVRSAFGRVTDYVDAEEMLDTKLFRWRTPGLYSIDAQLALALLDDALEHRGFDPARAGEALVALSRGDSQLEFGALRGADRDIKEAILALKQRTSWKTVGYPSAGGAPAARIAPLAAYHADQPHILPEIVIRASLLTHRDPIAVSAAAAVAKLTAELLIRDSLSNSEKEQLLTETAGFCREVEDRLLERYPEALEESHRGERLHIFSATVEELAARIENPYEQTHIWIAENANGFSDFEIKRPALNFALASVVFSICEFMRNSVDFEKALIAVVNEGGDADTNGAIAGALSGALHGESGIPENWLKGLANRKQLRARALALATGRFSRGAIEDLCEMESKLTLKEHEEREARMRKNRRYSASAERKAQEKTLRPAEKQKVDEKQIRKLRKQREWEKYYPQD
jgi:ADP-ribosylglycohydrolase